MGYAGEHGEDLFKACQAQIARDRLSEFNVSGRQVRTDSKPIGSNIARYTRYELIHDTGVEVVSASDSSFPTGALQRPREILPGNIESDAFILGKT